MKIIAIFAICLLLLGVGCNKTTTVVNTPAAGEGPEVAQLKASDNHLKQAKKFYSEGKYRQAQQHCEKAINFNHRNWEAHYYLGLTSQKRDEYYSSIKVFNSGLKYAPDNKFIKSEIHLAMGISWEKLGNLDKAENEFRMALAFNPENNSARQGKNRVKIEKTIKDWGKDVRHKHDG